MDDFINQYRYRAGTRGCALLVISVLFVITLWGLILSPLYDQFSVDREETTGIVETSSVKVSPGQPNFLLEYRYEVDGRSYVSEQREYGHLDQVKKKKANYPLGKKLVVYYQPHNPELATLSVGIKHPMWAVIPIGFLVLIYWVWGMFWEDVDAVRKRKAARMEKKESSKATRPAPQVQGQRRHDSRSALKVHSVAKPTGWGLLIAIPTLISSLLIFGFRDGLIVSAIIVGSGLLALVIWALKGEQKKLRVGSQSADLQLSASGAESANVGSVIVGIVTIYPKKALTGCFVELELRHEEKRENNYSDDAGPSRPYWAKRSMTKVVVPKSNLTLAADKPCKIPFAIAFPSSMRGDRFSHPDATGSERLILAAWLGGIEGIRTQSVRWKEALSVLPPQQSSSS